MSPRVTYLLKLGSLELQLSPYSPTPEDMRRSDELIASTNRTDAADPVTKRLADRLAIDAFVVDLLFRAASPNHPELTRDRIEEELDHRNIADAISSLRGLSLRYIAAIAPERMIH
jgi:hypothetical protein